MTNHSRTTTEEFEISAQKVVERIRALAKEASVRRIRVKTPAGRVALDIPLAVGAVAGGALVLATPLLSALAAGAALFGRVTVQVVREDTDPAEPSEPA